MTCVEKTIRFFKVTNIEVVAVKSDAELQEKMARRVRVKNEERLLATGFSVLVVVMIFGWIALILTQKFSVASELILPLIVGISVSIMAWRHFYKARVRVTMFRQKHSDLFLSQQ